MDADDTNGTGVLPTKMKPVVLVAVKNCWDLTTDLEPLPPPPPTLEEREGGSRNISHLSDIFRRQSFDICRNVSVSVVLSACLAINTFITYISQAVVENNKSLQMTCWWSHWWVTLSGLEQSSLNECYQAM